MGLISVRSEVQLLDGPLSSKRRPRNGLVPGRGLVFGVVKEKGVSIRVSIELHPRSGARMTGAPATSFDVEVDPRQRPQDTPGWRRSSRRRGARRFDLRRESLRRSRSCYPNKSACVPVRTKTISEASE